MPRPLMVKPSLPSLSRVPTCLLKTSIRVLWTNSVSAGMWSTNSTLNVSTVQSRASLYHQNTKTSRPTSLSPRLQPRQPRPQAGMKANMTSRPRAARPSATPTPACTCSSASSPPSSSATKPAKAASSISRCTTHVLTYAASRPVTS